MQWLRLLNKQTETKADTNFHKMLTTPTVRPAPCAGFRLLMSPTGSVSRVDQRWAEWKLGWFVNGGPL